MKCGVCKTPLLKVGFRRREYRDAAGRLYKAIHWPRYAPCRRLEDPEAHPSRARRMRTAGRQDADRHPRTRDAFNLFTGDAMRGDFLDEARRFEDIDKAVLRKIQGKAGPVGPPYFCCDPKCPGSQYPASEYPHQGTCDR